MPGPSGAGHTVPLLEPSHLLGQDRLVPRLSRGDRVRRGCRRRASGRQGSRRSRGSRGTRTHKVREWWREGHGM
eukprot:13114931-Alexandrium_andersonii.AAC.1